MGISTPTNRGTKTAAFTLNATTATISPASTMQAGNLQVLGLGSQLPAASRTLSSVTDTQSNTWNVINSVDNGTTDVVSMAYCIPVNAIGTTDSITITMSGPMGQGSTAYRIDLEEIANQGATQADTSLSASATGSGTSLTCGTSGTPSLNDEIDIAYWAITALESSVTAGANYTALGTVSAGAFSLVGEYRILTSAATQSPTMTAGTTGTWAGMQSLFQGIQLSPLPYKTPQWIYLRRNH